MKPVTMITRTLTLLVLVLLMACTGNVRETRPGEDPAAAVIEARNEVRAMANNTLQELYAAQPEAKRAVEGAAGYAVFSNFGMKILVAGGASGKGLAVSRATQEEIFMRMAEVQAGLGFGVKKFRLVWVFETPGAFDTFVNSGYTFGGQATLAAKTSGQGVAYTGAVSASPGVWIYQLTDDGLAAELTMKGTRYYRDKELAE